MKINPTNILLVEDNPDHAELTVKALQEEGDMINKIEVVGDGEEALEYLYHRGRYADSRRYPRPGLILLDIKLPKIDGIEVLQIIKKDENLRNIPVIVLTTSESDKDMLASYQYGVNSYITKPVGFREFSKRIKEMRYYWLLVNSLPE